MPDSSPYTVGPATYRSPHARLETKPSSVRYEYWDGERYKAVFDSGGGYERFRSWEYRPHTPGDKKEDVYAYHHRLLAVAWLFPDGWTAEDILPELAGRDVHHSAPEVDRDIGFKDDNRECCLHLRDHGGHSSITQADMRAWAEDSKADAYEPPEPERCGRCGGDLDTPCTSDDWSGRYCLSCAQAASDGSPIKVEG